MFDSYSSQTYVEDPKDRQSRSKSVGGSTTTPMPTLPAAPPTTVSTSRQPAKYKKRAFIATEGSSENEVDIDMDIEDNDSSGSSVGTSHVPTKRLQTSTIITRGSRTPGLEGPITHRHSPSTSNTVRRLNTPSTGAETEMGTGTEAEAETEIELEVSGVDASIPPSSTRVNSEDVITTLSHRSLVTDVDASGTGVVTRVGVCRVRELIHTSIVQSWPPSPLPMTDPDTGRTSNITRVGLCRVNKLINTPIARSQPSSPSPTPEPDPESIIPDFLTRKSNVYGYLSSNEEPGFRKLLKAHITFELANPLNTRSTLPTARRPKAITWWSDRARPIKLPPYDSLSSFASSITGWWIFIQPDWRKICLGEISCDGGDWECLYKPGVNGLLNVVILAHWWAWISEQREDGVGDDYIWFVSDVTWVLSQLTVIAHEGGV